MIKKLQSIFRKTLTIISPTLNTKVCYRVKFGRSLDLGNPKTLDEKILYLKLKDFETNALVRQCADKYRVREYVKNCGCEEILVNLINVYDDVDEIDWDILPSKFAMKVNVGCGGNIICTDKNKLNVPLSNKNLKKWMRKKHYLGYSEMQYKGIKPKIIVEEYLDDGNGMLPLDYKVYCFNGEAKYVMVCAEREKGHPLFFYYDKDWNLMPFSQDALNNSDYKLERPECLIDLFKYASILSKPFPFVRADFYCINNHVYFGELTFTPSGGMDNERLEEINLKFGKMLILDCDNDNIR